MCALTVDHQLDRFSSLTIHLLQEVLYIALIAGNFLNAGGYAGGAAGVRLASLQKLPDIRANKPGITLMHYVALVRFLYQRRRFARVFWLFYKCSYF